MKKEIVGYKYAKNKTTNVSHYQSGSYKTFCLFIVGLRSFSNAFNAQSRRD